MDGRLARCEVQVEESCACDTVTNVGAEWWVQSERSCRYLKHYFIEFYIICSLHSVLSSFSHSPFETVSL